MNYDWEEINELGQYEIGFIDIYKTKIEDKTVIFTISYLPQFEDKDQKILTTVLLEGNKKNWTEGAVKNILFDCEERINRVSNFKFRVFNRLEYMTIQILYIKNIEDIEFGTYGDFTFEKPIS